VHRGCWCGILRERDHSEDIGVDCKIILKLNLKKWDGNTLTGMIWLKIWTGACGCGNEPSGSLKCGEFLD
jgi:hypothetical protein